MSTAVIPLENPSEYDDYSEHHDYSPTHQGKMDRVSDMMRGGIRMGREELDALREELPILKDEEMLDKLIKTLYDEIGQSELSDRMSDAFELRQRDTRLIDAANKVRKSKGQGPINIKNKSVIPPKNMDFDD